MQKCIHPQCTDTDKLIHVSFDETDNLEAALGVTASPDNPLLCTCMCVYVSTSATPINKTLVHFRFGILMIKTLVKKYCQYM